MTGNTKTISGTLEIGVEVNGQLHRDFTLRLPTVGDEIDVAEDDSIPDSGFRVALLSRCLLSLGTLPEDAITFSLLREELTSDDFSQLARATEDLKKKRKSASETSTTSAAPVSDSDNTAGQRTRSAGSTL